MAGLISQVSSGNSTVMRNLGKLYVAWLILTNFIDIIYTNLLQSEVVKPENRIEYLSIEQMVQKNYSLYSTEAHFIRHVASGMQKKTRDLDVEDKGFVRRLQIIGGRVEDVHSAVLHFLSQMNAEKRTALIEGRSNIELSSKILQNLNLHPLRGKERFLDFPSFWLFKATKGFMLVRSLERMKATGVLEYLLKEAEKAEVAISLKNISAHAKHSSINNPRAFRIGLSDSVLREAFKLLFGGLSFSFFAFVFETGKTLIHHYIGLAILWCGRGFLQDFC